MQKNLHLLFLTMSYNILTCFSKCEPTCGSMVRGTVVSQLTRIQILVLAFVPDLFQNFRQCAFSGRRCFRRRRGAYGDFVSYRMISPSCPGRHRRQTIPLISPPIAVQATPAPVNLLLCRGWPNYATLTGRSHGK